MASVTSALPYTVTFLLLLCASGLLWWSHSATFMCYAWILSACKHSFCNCIFVPVKGGTLAIIMDFVNIYAYLAALRKNIHVLHIPKLLY